jgi:hypothetical protein
VNIKATIKKAIEIVDRAGLPRTEMPRTVLMQSIADALDAASRAPKGCVLDDEGLVRKVLGTLPVTADGCFYAHHSRYDPPVFGITRGGKVVHAAVRAFPLPDDMSFSPSDVYSTREAAEAAREVPHDD